MDSISQVSGWIFSRTPEWMNRQHISGEKKKVGFSHPVQQKGFYQLLFYHSSLDRPALLKEWGQWSLSFRCRQMCLHRGSKGNRWHGNENKMTGLTALTGVYEFKNENALQLWREDDDRLLFHDLRSHHRGRSNWFYDARGRRARTNDRLELASDLPGIWTPCLWDGSVLSSPMTTGEQPVTFTEHCPFWVCIPSKPGRSAIRIRYV